MDEYTQVVLGYETAAFMIIKKSGTCRSMKKDEILQDQ
jgi:hypothetical protein